MALRLYWACQIRADRDKATVALAAAKVGAHISECQNTRNIWLLFPWNNEDWAILLVRKGIGLLFTAIAIAQGAPFWFDLLNRVIRGSANNVNTAQNASGGQAGG